MKDELRKLARALGVSGNESRLSREDMRLVEDALAEAREAEERRQRITAEVQQAGLIYREAKRLGRTLNYADYSETIAGHLKALYAEEQAQERAAAAERAAAEEAARKKAEADRLAKEQAAERLRLDRIANIEKHYPTIWD